MMLLRTEPAMLLLRSPEELPDVSSTMRDVALEGDAGVARAAARFGDPPPRCFERAEIRAAYDALEPTLRDALERTADQIRAFAMLQRASLRDISVSQGGFELSQRAIPVRSVGIYVPGGRYPLPSSLLMGVVPARVAGVERVIVCTPRASNVMLAAASIAGADELFEIGGAQAIAALAYGTESIPRVDLIAGPGNSYVAAAKRAVSGVCGTDAFAGPSEVLIVASNDADPRLVAADLLAQAEHDVEARALLLTDDPSFADAVDAELKLQLPQLSTENTARASLERYGRYAVLPLDEAIELANELAPEHLELHGTRAEALAPRARCYGALFIGDGAGEVFGDYGSGPNHVLPTGRTARFSGGLSVLTFLTIRTTQRAIGKPDASAIARTALLAEAEGLDAHRRAALMRSLSVPV